MERIGKTRRTAVHLNTKEKGLEILQLRTFKLDHSKHLISTILSFRHGSFENRNKVRQQ